MKNILSLLNYSIRILQLDKGDEYRFNAAIPLKKAIEELESLWQQNTALQQERSNMQKTYQSTIKSYQQDILALQARIKELEEPKTCESCNAEFNNDCNLGFLPKNMHSFEFYCNQYKQKKN